jgi:hypothetical protein
MMDCLILGDSIAVGVSNFRQECVSLVKGGITSKRWNISYMNRPAFDMAEYNTAIISLGSNDEPSDLTAEMLQEIRETVKARTVFWIIPAIKPKIQDIVLKMARQNGDRVVYIKELARDGIHPTTNGYKWLAYETK